jgi:hypothetical protein
LEVQELREVYSWCFSEKKPQYLESYSDVKAFFFFDTLACCSMLSRIVEHLWLAKQAVNQGVFLPDTPFVWEHCPRMPNASVFISLSRVL